MPEQFTEYRVHSLTNPNNGVGLMRGFPYLSKQKYFTRQELEDLQTALYEEDFLIKRRGEDRYREEFVLQGKCGSEWLTIKEVSLLPGDGLPPDYGNCKDCGDELVESEFAVGVICCSCLEVIHDRRESSTW